ncbi:unnamed protein product [Soboliphyme baturini]|uniref:Mediator of RNA polymerase II transcription subunit 14 n=1 Tax=Soboliphyme baturini TaxID=241478 RepID=A0A183IU15_9BILA|nr:unnamed protein product [Soboliphyme baturini]
MSTMKNPINELYDVLHLFCLSLQLDIICCQAAQMISEQRNENMAVDEYVRGQRLVITYWKDHIYTPGPKQQNELETAKSVPIINHKLIIYTSQDDPNKPLQVQHMPKSDLLDLPTSISCQKLSLENLLADTVLVRIRHRLQQLKERIEFCLGIECEIVGQLPSLLVHLVDPCTKTEILFIVINFFTGRFISDVPVMSIEFIFCVNISSIFDLWPLFSEHNPVFDELDRMLNRAAWAGLRSAFVNLRTLIVMSRCGRMASFLPFRITDSLPIVTEPFIAKVVSGHHLFLRFLRYDGFYMILEFKQENDGSTSSHYYLFTSSSADALSLLFPKARTAGSACEILKPVNLIKLDPAAIARGGRRSSVVKIHNASADYVTDLAVVFTVCEQRIPFFMLIEALNSRGIIFQTCEDEQEGCMILYIIGFTMISGIKRHVFDKFWDTVLSCFVRLTNDKNRLHWTFECVFSNVPLQGIRHVAAAGGGEASADHTKMIVLNYRVNADNALKCVDEFLNSMHTFASLYEPVRTYTYYKLTLGYGPNKSFAVTVQWRHTERTFVLTFGVYDKAGAAAVDTNPHCWMSHHLQQMFNERRDLIYLSKLLHESISALVALQRLPDLLVHGLTDHQGQLIGVGHLFCVIPVNMTTVHVIYKWLLCLEVVFLSGDVVGLRDCGALTPVSSPKHSARYLPIVGFKSFLSLHEKLDKCAQKMQQQSCYDAEQKSPYIHGEFTDSLTRCYLDNKTSSPASFPLPSSGSVIGQTPAGVAFAVASAMPPVMSPAVVTSSQNVGSSMSPSPLSHSGVGLLTPSPAPASNSSLLMSLSPNSFSQTSPTPVTTQPVLSPATTASPFAVIPSVQPAPGLIAGL